MNLRVAIAGLVGGGFVAAGLALPLYVLVVQPWTGWYSAPIWIGPVGFLANFVFFAAFGHIGARAGHAPRNPLTRMQYGAVTGLLMSTVGFCLVGGAGAAVHGQGPFFLAVLESAQRVDLHPGAAALYQSVVGTASQVNGLFWSLVLTGTATGGLGGLTWRGRGGWGPRPAPMNADLQGLTGVSLGLLATVVYIQVFRTSAAEIEPLARGMRTVFGTEAPAWWVFRWGVIGNAAAVGAGLIWGLRSCAGRVHCIHTGTRALARATMGLAWVSPVALVLVQAITSFEAMLDPANIVGVLAIGVACGGFSWLAWNTPGSAPDLDLAPEAVAAALFTLMMLLLALLYGPGGTIFRMALENGMQPGLEEMLEGGDITALDGAIWSIYRGAFMTAVSGYAAAAVFAGVTWAALARFTARRR